MYMYEVDVNESLKRFILYLRNKRSERVRAKVVYTSCHGEEVVQKETELKDEVIVYTTGFFF